MVACRVYIREYSPESLLKDMSYIPVFLLTCGQAVSFAITYVLQQIFANNLGYEIYICHGIMFVWPIFRLVLI